MKGSGLVRESNLESWTWLPTRRTVGTGGGVGCEWKNRRSESNFEWRRPSERGSGGLDHIAYQKSRSDRTLQVTALLCQ